MVSTKTILIVDDDSDDQYLICTIFKRSQISFSPTFASSLDDARKQLSAETFDIVTLDGNLRGDMGYHLISDIKNSSSCNARIIMFSGQDECVAEGLRRGADYGFSKNLLMQPMKFSESFDSLIPVKVPAKIKQQS